MAKVMNSDLKSNEQAVVKNVLKVYLKGRASAVATTPHGIVGQVMGLL